MKTAFSPGPGMDLYEFCRMPFGVTGGPSSLQQLMDKVLHGLPFVTSYIDDVLIPSNDIEHHKAHLQQLLQVFARLRGRAEFKRNKMPNWDEGGSIFRPCILSSW